MGYFENQYGEQWVFTSCRRSGQATLRGGDMRWNTELEVIDGRVPNLILDDPERRWLAACWVATRK